MLSEIRHPFNHICWIDFRLIFGEEIFYFNWGKSPNDVVIAQMLKTGFVPGNGLGKDQKGITEPIFLSGQIDTKGFGYSF